MCRTTGESVTACLLPPTQGALGDKDEAPRAWLRHSTRACVISVGTRDRPKTTCRLGPQEQGGALVRGCPSGLRGAPARPALRW